MNCNDQNPCTTDACDALTGCQHVANTEPCPDSNKCTTGKTCVASQCTPGSAVICNDNNPCTDDSCAPASGCVYQPNAAGCTDNDNCNAGQCVGSVVNCDDGKVCTNDSCSSTSGCVHTNNTVGCNDNNGCTSNDKCASGSCAGSTVLTCPSGWGSVKAGGKCIISSINQVILKDTPYSVLANWQFPYAANSGYAAVTNLKSEWISGGCLNWDFVAVKLTCNKATIQLPNQLMGLDSPGFPKSYIWTEQGLGEYCSISQLSNGWTPVFYPICTRRLTFSTTWTVDAKCSW